MYDADGGYELLEKNNSLQGVMFKRTLTDMQNFLSAQVSSDRARGDFQDAINRLEQMRLSWVIGKDPRTLSSEMVVEISARELPLAMQGLALIVWFEGPRTVCEFIRWLLEKLQDSQCTHPIGGSTDSDQLLLQHFCEAGEPPKISSAIGGLHHR